MSKDLRKRMADKHEEFVAKLFGSRTNPGSGNQWNRQMDGRTDVHRQRFAFAWDCKATRAASMSVGLPMWIKAHKQSGGEHPAIPLRFYGNDHLDLFVDLILVDLNTFHEVVEAANRIDDLKEALKKVRANANKARQEAEERDDALSSQWMNVEFLLKELGF